MDSRTAYQHCHELQDNQFGSVQGSMSAMWDYQKMVLGMLTDSVLESTLWNKSSSQLTTRDKGNHNRLSPGTIVETFAYCVSGTRTE